MRIIADENIPFAREAFGTLGDVTLVHGRSLSAEQVAHADLLFVRSIAKVQAPLLNDSSVRFVATATAGIDHVDTAYLEKLGIGFAAAPGCNANSVAEYMAAAWLVLARKKGFRLRGLRLGIIGVGAVGSRVEEKARALGMELVLNDPPKGRETGDSKYRPIDEVFDCDIVTCHTPLTRDGLDPTFHLANEAFFSRLRKGAIFCNAGRGEMVDEAALHRAIDAGRLSAVALDVWENEPRIDPLLLEKADIGTPHIAGYSYDGKIKGTIMVYEAVCRFLDATPTWDAAKAMLPPEVEALEIDCKERSEESVLHAVVQRLYPIERDDAALRATIKISPEERGKDFDRQRKQYPYRREFHNTRLTLRNASNSLRATFRGLGFLVQE